jgi:hypothetical protein
MSPSLGVAQPPASAYQEHARRFQNKRPDEIPDQAAYAFRVRHRPAMQRDSNAAGGAHPVSRHL